MKQMLQNLRHPRVAVVVHDLVMVVLAWLASSWLVERISGIPLAHGASLVTELAVVVVLQTAVLWYIGLYKGLWRFASFQDMWNILRSALFGTILIISSLALISGSVQSKWLQSLVAYPVLLFVLLGLPRMCYRFWKDSHLPQSQQGMSGLTRVLILGAGHSGALLERELRHRGGHEILGFLDDNNRLRGAQVHGVPVLGTIDGLSDIGQELDAELVIIAMPSANNQQMQRIVEICEKSEIKFRTLPTMQDLGNRATR